MRWPISQTPKPSTRIWAALPARVKRGARTPEDIPAASEALKLFSLAAPNFFSK